MNAERIKDHLSYVHLKDAYRAVVAPPRPSAEDVLQAKQRAWTRYERVSRRYIAAELVVWAVAVLNTAGPRSTLAAFLVSVVSVFAIVAAVRARKAYGDELARIAAWEHGR